MRIMPVKPVTHNKYSDMKRYTWIWIMLIALLSGCEDDFDRGGSNPGEGAAQRRTSESEEGSALRTRSENTEIQLSVTGKLPESERQA